ncbi:MAG: flagellar basal body-associated FliL family protein [Thalassolituus sp.]|jgi:flagellar FliL protein|uniref:Flagellar protein FliL n=2 Tax=root TaxID=1 RepID=M5E9T5_9GAMM|nr:flagellar basal body-associated FliL family protein [Thalassolituus oleivorans]MBQ0728498.1 flagellar basal body-associated FliL family protein [Thalassolituus oleivorans]PCI47718.1 MAG: flagellar basal body-associated protein FliL [Oceanospirillales bacterium]PHQ84691.1 MAG: flagellar basal body-associated protein FliL [Thalassobium sp.]CCU74021.1 flagellar protein [Thalassolituus oleivorans MIL-1]
MNWRAVWLWCGLTIAAMMSPLAWAEDAAVDAAEGEGEAAGPQTRYIYMEPAFVVNYGSTGRMKYLRTEVALKVSSAEAAGKVSEHKPYLRNNLVMMFSAQESEIMNSSQGREQLRKLALDEVRAVMEQLEGMPYIDDLYFSNFVVQN